MAMRLAFATYLVVLTAVIAFMLSAPAPAVRLTSDADDRIPVPPEPMPVPPPPVPLPGSDSLIRLIDRVTVEGPFVDRGLSVFVLVARDPENRLDYLAFDEGIASGQIVVQEFAAGTVPTLQVRNLGDRWAFLLAGELVAGGKQSRTVREDALLPLHSAAWINLPVYCIEQRRAHHRRRRQGEIRRRGDEASSREVSAPIAERPWFQDGHGEVWVDSRGPRGSSRGPCFFPENWFCSCSRRAGEALRVPSAGLCPTNFPPQFPPRTVYSFMRLGPQGPPCPKEKEETPLHEMHLAQTVFGELERLAGRYELTKVSRVRLRVLDADKSCLVESLKMLFHENALFREAKITAVESKGKPDPNGTRVIIERIEGDKDEEPIRDDLKR